MLKLKFCGQASGFKAISASLLKEFSRVKKAGNKKAKAAMNIPISRQIRVIFP